MLVPESVHRVPGIVFKRHKIQHDSCGGQFVIDAVRYLSLDEWPGFRDFLNDDQVGVANCNSCISTAAVTFPLIVELPKRNLLVFATPGNDDGGVDAGFRTVFDEVCAALPARITERAAKRPYTFVYGFRGLRVLLDAMDDLPIPKPSPPYEHAPDTEMSFTRLDGYKYGPLHFYYPGQRTIDNLVCALLEWASMEKGVSDLEKVAETGEGILQIVGPHHPWLLQELGRIYVELGRLYDAERILELALRAQHCWLAVTASFLDATPSRRADAEPQDGSLPHALPTSILLDVTSVRHCVTRQRPAYNDYGFWHFPRTEDYAHPESYTTRAVYAARGFATGRLSRYFLDDKRRRATSGFSLRLGELLSENKQNIEFDLNSHAEEVREFWQNYADS